VSPRSALAYLAWLFAAWSASLAFLFPSVEGLPESLHTVVAEGLRFAIFVAPAWWWARRHHAPLGTGFSATALATGALVAAPYVLVAAAVAVWAEHRTFQPAQIPLRFWFTGFTASTLMEELAFRGFLIGALERWGPGRAIVLSAMAFSAIHFPGWYALSMHPAAVDWLKNAGAIFLLGCVTGGLYWKTRSVWATSLVHALNNLVAVALVTTAAR
jgi:membrane protease YdiL (CAAX protease family)